MVKVIEPPSGESGGLRGSAAVELVFAALEQMSVLVVYLCSPSSRECFHEEEDDFFKTALRLARTTPDYRLLCVVEPGCAVRSSFYFSSSSNIASFCSLSNFDKKNRSVS